MTVADLAQIVPGILKYDGPVLAFLLLIVVIRSRRLTQFRVFLDELDRFRALFGKRQSWSENALEITLKRMEDVEAIIQEQSRILAKVRASATISEHLDVIEKVVLVSEQLEKLKRTVEQTFQEAIKQGATIRQDRTREVHGHFKVYIEQTRKNLEKSVGDRLSAYVEGKSREELLGNLVNSLRHALLSISKQNLDSLQAFSEKSTEDFEHSIRQSLSKVCAAIEELRQKYDEAPWLLAGVQGSNTVSGKEE